MSRVEERFLLGSWAFDGPGGDMPVGEPAFVGEAIAVLRWMFQMRNESRSPKGRQKMLGSDVLDEYCD